MWFLGLKLRVQVVFVVGSGVVVIVVRGRVGWEQAAGTYGNRDQAGNRPTGVDRRAAADTATLFFVEKVNEQGFWVGGVWYGGRKVALGGAADSVLRDPRSSFGAVGQIPRAIDGRKDRIKGESGPVMDVGLSIVDVVVFGVVSRSQGCAQRKEVDSGALCGYGAVGGASTSLFPVDSPVSKLLPRTVRGGVAVDPSTGSAQVARKCRPLPFRDSLEWSRPVVPEWKAKVGPSLFRFPSVTAAVSLFLLAFQTPTN
ncbi:hypothetical protein B0T20DRAFT_393398 [Sordaria brevicollis]|uniref:Uncharacterized protein n=1 Tax=Sordaria brevicollis TaxID=83679 RepID=A0AAE0PCT5_SORBR|nr:hypothetical protein B0T20DRAFT_393398 [Sordaria brevicollis]